MEELKSSHGFSERRACEIADQSRSTQRRKPVVRSDEKRLTKRIIDLACDFGRYGYRKITHLLRNEGWKVNKKRVQRIWRQEGLRVPHKQPKRRRLWMNDGSCIRLRPRYKNHVWSYDFVHDRTSDGRVLKMLTIIDEYTRECLKIEIGRSLKSMDVLEAVYELFMTRGIPDHIRSDNGSEFSCKLMRRWLRDVGVKTLFIEPGSPWENGYNESFNGILRNEVLNREVFDTVVEARVIIGRWRRIYNGYRPHGSLGGRPPVPETFTEKISA